MPSHRRLSTALVTVAVITAGSGMAIAASGSAGGDDEHGTPLTLSGTVEGLTPGAARTLAVTIANPNVKPIVVAAVATSVTSPSGACPAAALTVGDLTSPVTVPAGASAAGRLPVRLAADAPDACQGAVFALRFAATGRGDGSLVAPTPETPGTTTAPAVPPATVTPSAKWKTVTVKRRKKVCRTRKVRVRGKVRRRKVCRVVVVKVKVKVRVAR
jgi:hypothetical protein